MEHALTVLGASAVVGSAAVFAIQSYSNKAWVEWWDRDLDSDDEEGKESLPPQSAHAETLAKRDRSRATELVGDHAGSGQKHQKDMMTQEQLDRSSEIGRLLMGNASESDVRAKIAELRERAEKDMKSGRPAQAMRLKTVLDILVYVLVFIAIAYLLSTEYNFNLSRAAKSMAPTETGVLYEMGSRFQLLRAMWQKHVLVHF